MNAGYFYCPYISLQESPTVLAPEGTEFPQDDARTVNDHERWRYDEEDYDPYYDPDSVCYMGGNIPIDFDWLKEGF